MGRNKREAVTWEMDELISNMSNESLVRNFEGLYIRYTINDFVYGAKDERTVKDLSEIKLLRAEILKRLGGKNVH